jgi:pfkB family carbohydrate kinase/nucleoside 2-deoxyribosyltransferase-like protein
LIVVGGAYRERCNEPRFDRLRGSGLRAGIALRQAAKSLVVHTCIDASERAELDATAGVFGIEIRATTRTAPIVFSYFTPLSAPGLQGRGATMDGAIEAEDDTVLRFGLVEEHPTIRLTSKTLVIDPQGDAAALPLEGASFDRLAIVANERETLRLGREDILEKAIERLRAETGAAAVVAKCGARGAIVSTSAGQVVVGAFESPVVSPIGSGDVFAAVFAYQFGEESSDAVDAAREASRFTAQWCSDPSEPGLGSSAGTLVETAFGPRPTVYLGGPFFSLGQSWLVDLVRGALHELGATPFSPQHDVGRGGAEVAKPDLDGLIGSASMLALLDEFDPGTLFEVGYAVRAGIPVIGYLNPRPQDHLVMLEGTEVDITTDLATAVYRSIWRGLRRG